MNGLVVKGILFLALVIALNEIPRAFAADPELGHVLHSLSRSQTGQSLIALAEKSWGLEPGDATLLRYLKWGDASKTDAVLTRFLNPKTGEERRERRVSILLKRGQNEENLILDLAHELVHASTRPIWDPYDPSLTAGRYIHSAIDGPGGEVDAVIAECRVGLELGIETGSALLRCKSYFKGENPNGQALREQVASDFYRSGIWAEALKKKLGAETESLLPLLSAGAPVLYSSTGKLPYPMALYQEFQALTEIACQNSLNRLASRSGPVRSLASRFVTERCRLPESKS